MRKHTEKETEMNKIILAFAALSFAAGSALAQPVNSKGERKYDYASTLQEGKSIQAESSERGIDYTPTASTGDSEKKVNWPLAFPVWN